MRPTFKEILSAFGRFLLELPIELSSFIITPIALLFCKKNDEHLPKILAWYDEPRWGIKVNARPLFYKKAELSA